MTSFPHTLFETILTVAVIIPALTLLGWWTASYYLSPLRRYPGPFLAKFTNLWRFFIVRQGNVHLEIKKLHEKHGPVVRIGPNLLDLDIPDLIKDLYGTDGKWLKTDFYHNNSAVVNGKITHHIFSITDDDEHARMKRPVAKYYSLSSVLGLEPLIEAVTKDFISQLNARFAVKGAEKKVDLGEWLAFYSWDVNGAATYSERFGYMDHGSDFDNTLLFADKALDYFAAVGQLPWLDFLLDKNPVKRIGPPNLTNATGIAVNHFMARMQGKDPNFDPNVPDFLQHFINSKKEYPNYVHDGIVMSYLLVNLIAGADTTAITLRAIFYFLLKHREAYDKLVDEILSATHLGTVIKYNAARNLPYLDAVIRESMRLHPAVCMLLERYVPRGGLILPDKSHVAAGTAVGINPYVINRNKGVYGDDADNFRPERWLQAKGESTTAYSERMRLFNATDLTFGGGSHMCLGRNFAIVEIYKLVPTLIQHYEMELADPKAEWKVTGSWFPRQKGIMCHLKQRS